MWKGLDDSGTGKVNLAEYRTLLQNSAYMFCHHGQGLLYLDDSGQQLPLEGEEDDVERIIIPRAEWDAGDITAGPIGHIPGIVIHHTVTPTTAAWGDEPETVWRRVHSIDHDHREHRGLGGMGYHFLIGYDGSIFDGRPSNLLGAHAGDIGKNHYIGIAVVGSYHPDDEFYNPEQSSPPQAQLNALFSLITQLITEIPTIKSIIPHHDQCPGPWYDNHDWDRFL